MSNLEELIRLMKGLEDQLVVCMRCGMCQAVCPVYTQTGREADVARGKLALLDGLMKEMLDDPGRSISDHAEKQTRNTRPPHRALSASLRCPGKAVRGRRLLQCLA